MNHVREFRIALGLSQLALSKKIGVARQTVNLIRSDKYNPSLDLCIKLAEALKRSQQPLLELAREENKNKEDDIS